VHWPKNGVLAQMPEESTVRMLRWVFSRAGETLLCELSLDSGAFAYRLCVSTDDHARTFSEQFGDVAKAFERQCQLESALLEEGWTLDSYESAPLAV
jgi:hypothetical protein